MMDIQCETMKANAVGRMSKQNGVISDVMKRCADGTSFERNLLDLALEHIN